LEIGGGLRLREDWKSAERGGNERDEGKKRFE
jgi:hypothetical protein